MSLSAGVYGGGSQDDGRSHESFQIFNTAPFYFGSLTTLLVAFCLLQERRRPVRIQDGQSGQVSLPTLKKWNEEKSPARTPCTFSLEQSGTTQLATSHSEVLTENGYLIDLQSPAYLK